MKRTGLYCLFALNVLAAVSGCAETKNSTTNTASATALKYAYQDAFLAGTAVNEEIVSGHDTLSRVIVISQFNSITAENVMKAAIINPEPGVFNFQPADDFVVFGEKNDMFIIGHTLVWHNQCPPWFFTNSKGQPNSKSEQIERLREHIRNVAGQVFRARACVGCGE